MPNLSRDTLVGTACRAHASRLLTQASPWEECAAVCAAADNCTSFALGEARTMMELMLAYDCVTFNDQAETSSHLEGSSEHCYLKQQVSPSVFERHEFVLTSTSPHAPEVMLNGRVLQAETEHAGSLPAMAPEIVKLELELNSTDTLEKRSYRSLYSATIAPLSINFLVFPHAHVPSCIDSIESGPPTSCDDLMCKLA